MKKVIELSGSQSPNHIGYLSQFLVLPIINHEFIHPSTCDRATLEAKLSDWVPNGK